jgi:ComF family protein
LLAAALSAPCAVCARVTDTPLAGPVCTACWSSLRIVAPPICERCGYPLARGRDATAARVASCGACRSLHALDMLRAPGVYEGALRDIVHAFKYTARRSLARPLAALIARRCASALDGADALVPVPLHWSRRWSRGFNQADLLARALGIVVVRALRRTRPTQPQMSLQATGRRGNVAGAFALVPAWRRRHALAGRVLVLVDDVCTTGTTLDECARVLKDAGAAEVRAVTVARTLMHSA